MTPRGRTRRPARSTAERVSFAVASAVVLAVALTIAVLGLREERPPELSATLVGSPRTSGSQEYVRVDVRNTGTEAAEAVRVVAEVGEGTSATPVGEQVVDFLAGGDTITVVLVLDAADLTGLTVRVESYTESR